RGVTYPRLEGAGLQYPVPTDDSSGTSFLFDDRFPTADGKGTFVPVEYAPPVELPDEEYPFVMNTGRQLDHWPRGPMTRHAPVLDPYAKMAELKCCAVRLEAAQVAVAD